MTSRNREPDGLRAWLRLAYEDAGCPPPESFLTESLKRLSDEDREALEAHVGSCPACAAERELARGFEAPAEMTPELRKVMTRLEAGSRTEGRRLPHWLPAAAAVAAIAVSVGLWRASQPPPLPERSAGSVRRGAVVTLDAPIGALSRAPETLRWRPVEGAARYRVRLERVDFELLWSAEVEESSVVLPAGVREHLQPAVTYLWSVEALDEAGRSLGRSPRTSFVMPSR